VIPVHAVAVFSQEKDKIDVAVVVGVERFVIPEVKAEVQEGDFGGEAEELVTGAVLVGLGGVPDVIKIDGEGGLPPGEGEEVGVEVDVDAGGVAEGDFEGDGCMGGFGTRPYGRVGTRPYGRVGSCPYGRVGSCPYGRVGSWVGGFRSRPYECPYEAEGCHVGCDGVVVFGMDEDVNIAEGAGGGIGVEVGDEGPAF